MVSPQKAKTEKAITVSMVSPALVKRPGRKVIKTVLIEDIRKEFYVRSALDQDRVIFLAGLVESGTVLDPVVLTDDNEIIDGRHRLEAYVMLDCPTVEAEIRHYENEVGKIAAAVQANQGGSLPCSVQDLRHAVESMILAGAKMKQLRDFLPFFTSSYINKLHKEAHGTISKRKISLAMNALSEGGITISQAAEKFDIDLATLKTALKGRSKKEKGSSFKTLKSQIDTRTRSMSQMYRQISSKVFSEYTDGEVGDAYVQKVLAAMAHGAKKSARYIEGCKGRFEELQRKTKRSGSVGAEEDED